MRKKVRDLRFTGYAIQYKELTGSKCILFCTCENREYVEIVLEKAADFENEELLWDNTILFVETESIRKNKRNRYRIFYRDTKRSTMIYAESMELYQSGYFIGEVGRYAVIEWNQRHICPPSLMAAILMLETDQGKKPVLEIKELVAKRTNDLAAWKKEKVPEDHGRFLWGQGNYILAVQYFQKAVRLCFEEKEMEKMLISVIEENRLTRFDS